MRALAIVSLFFGMIVLSAWKTLPTTATSEVPAVFSSGGPFPVGFDPAKYNVYFEEFEAQLPDCDNAGTDPCSPNSDWIQAGYGHTGSAGATGGD